MEFFYGVHVDAYDVGLIQYAGVLSAAKQMTCVAATLHRTESSVEGELGRIDQRHDALFEVLDGF